MKLMHDMLADMQAIVKQTRAVIDAGRQSIAMADHLLNNPTGPQRRRPPS
jgi:hypothetical protein